MNEASSSNEAGLHRLKPFFCLCAITLGCRGISYGFFYLGFLGSSSSAMGFSLLLTIAVAAVVASLYLLHVHARLIAEPSRTLREFYLVSRELLYDEYARTVIAMYACRFIYLSICLSIYHHLSSSSIYACKSVSK